MPRLGRLCARSLAAIFFYCRRNRLGRKTDDTYLGHLAAYSPALGLCAEVFGSLEVRRPVVIASQKEVALLTLRGCSSSLAAFSGFQNFVSAFSYFKTVNMPVARW